MERGKMMRAGIAGSDLKQDLDVVKQIVRALEIQCGEAAIIMEAGGVWIKFKGACGVGEGLLVMTGIEESSNGGD
jgi:hypothetical protein